MYVCVLYLNLFVSANQKSIIDKHTHKKKKKNKKKPKYNTKKSHQSHEKRSKKEDMKEDLKKKFKTINKVAIKTYILIITLNVNGLITPTKRQRLTECERVNS